MLCSRIGAGSTEPAKTIARKLDKSVSRKRSEARSIVAIVGLTPGTDPSHVPPEVMRHFALIYAPTLVALYGVAFVLLSGYRITRASHQETLRPETK